MTNEDFRDNIVGHLKLLRDISNPEEFQRLVGIGLEKYLIQARKAEEDRRQYVSELSDEGSFAGIVRCCCSACMELPIEERTEILKTGFIFEIAEEAIEYVKSVDLKEVNEIIDEIRGKFTFLVKKELGVEL